MEKINYENSKIVIIDDDQQVLESVRDALEFEKMKVIIFANPIEGLEYLKNNEADVLLLDYYMPEMNGSEVVSKLREYNNKTIVILQTGYADKVPPLDMIDSINIQGYVDKNEGIEKLILTTKSAIKTARLMEEIRTKDDEIKRLTYQKALIGDLISNLVNEAKDQLFQISMVNSVIKKDSDDYIKESELIENAIEKIYKLYDALNFESEKEMSIFKLEQTIQQLLKAKLLLKNAKLLFEIENNNIIIDNSTDLIYLLIKIVDFLVDSNSKDITVKVKDREEKILFEIKADINIDNIDIEELELVQEKQNILVLINDETIVINIEK